jgi:rhodanese-related sulfurtransferase
VHLLIVAEINRPPWGGILASAKLALAPEASWLSMNSAASTKQRVLIRYFSQIGKGELMAHQHPPRFLKIVDDARTRVRETTVDEVKKRLDRGDKFMLVDVREESEYAKDHLPGAIHLGKGVIERDIEARVPDLQAEMVLYCGGGFRSALAADNLQKMGYTNVISMDGGIRGWREKGFPLTKE